MIRSDPPNARDKRIGLKTVYPERKTEPGELDRELLTAKFAATGHVLAADAPLAYLASAESHVWWTVIALLPKGPHLTDFDEERPFLVMNLFDYTIEIGGEINDAGETWSRFKVDTVARTQEPIPFQQDKERYTYQRHLRHCMRAVRAFAQPFWKDPQYAPLVYPKIVPIPVTR